jgi:hypothetical protein
VQRPRLDRLHQGRIGRRSLAVGLGLEACRRRQHDMAVEQVGPGADPLGQLLAQHAGHMLVGQHEIERDVRGAGALDHGKGGEAVLRFHHRQAPAFELAAIDPPIERQIVDHERTLAVERYGRRRPQPDVGELDRVADQVQQHLAQPQRIAASNHAAAGEVDQQRPARGPCGRLAPRRSRPRLSNTSSSAKSRPRGSACRPRSSRSRGCR